MFSIANRHRLKIILERISEGEEITLKERLFVDKFADQNQTVASCLRKARRLQQRKEPKDEIALLIIHGILHLFGYDHAEDVDQQTMWRLQQSILNDLGSRGIL